MEQTADFTPLPEPYLTWYKARVWAFVSVGTVVSREPVWRNFAGVPVVGWSFNYSMGNPGWTRLPEVEL